MKIAVGSKNPVKIEAVRLAFSAVWPDEAWEIMGIDVASGVAEQPMSDEESILGARNRARAAMAAADADYGVGLEGGLGRVGNDSFNCGWMAVIDAHGNEGIGSTARILTPPKVVSLIEEGLELGAANDRLFGAENSKQKEGHFGLMTKNLITRTEAYRDGIIVALARFLHPHLFE